MSDKFKIHEISYHGKMQQGHVAKQIKGKLTWIKQHVRGFAQREQQRTRHEQLTSREGSLYASALLMGK
jgi:hypothetical protein